MNDSDQQVLIKTIV